MAYEYITKGVEPGYYVNEKESGMGGSDVLVE